MIPQITNGIEKSTDLPNPLCHIIATYSYHRYEKILNAFESEYKAVKEKSDNFRNRLKLMHIRIKIRCFIRRYLFESNKVDPYVFKKVAILHQLSKEEKYRLFDRLPILFNTQFLSEQQLSHLLKLVDFADQSLL